MTSIGKLSAIWKDSNLNHCKKIVITFLNIRLVILSSFKDNLLPHLEGVLICTPLKLKCYFSYIKVQYNNAKDVMGGLKNTASGVGKQKGSEERSEVKIVIVEISDELD